MKMVYSSVVSAFNIIVTLLFPNFVTGSEYNMKPFEGDMLMNCDKIAELYGREAAAAIRRQGMCDDELYDSESSDSEDQLQDLRLSRMWDTRKYGRVIIPYKFEPLDFMPSTEFHIFKQMDFIEKETGVVKFVEQTDEEYFLLFRNDPIYCSSYIGKMRIKYQPQRVLLNYPGCMRSGTIQHEILHALGFYHEHSRIDRDDYVDIKLENVLAGAEANFLKREGSDSLGAPYDYGSVMHYSAKAFSKNAQDTIDSKGKYIGQRRGMSEIDIIQVRLLYQCMSGERRLDDYNKNPCTSDCQCWEDARGCNGNDEACQEDLKCKNNVCKKIQLPTHSPSAMPTALPSDSPIVVPTTLPSNSSTMPPSTFSPTNYPSDIPTSLPSEQTENPPPTHSPSAMPTALPSDSPIVVSTTLPSNSPIIPPSTSSPTNYPSDIPTSLPSEQTENPPPTHSPSAMPTALPSDSPIVVPTTLPSNSPIIPPSTSSTTNYPSDMPTSLPSEQTENPTSIVSDSGSSWALTP